LQTLSKTELRELDTIVFQYKNNGKPFITRYQANTYRN